MKKIIITEGQLKKLVKQIHQPTGISCGPTCIKMVGDFYKGKVDEIDEICKHCGTDSIVGTPPDRMKKGLEKLNIQYVEHIDEENPYQSLRDVIDNGSLCIVRTFTHGVPHWIVIHSYDENDPSIFNVNDPWLGQLTYDEEELNKIWKDRNYFFFEIVKENGKDEEEIDEHSYQGDVVIRTYNPDTDKKIIFNRLGEVFNKTGLGNKTIWNMIGEIDEQLSIVAEIDGEVGGFYFLKESDIPETDNEIYQKLSQLNGIEGVALGVFKEYKQYGIGKDLIEYPKTLGYDYIWGYQLKSLENIEDWLKRRKIYYENDNLYITYQIYKNNIDNKEEK